MTVVRVEFQYSLCRIVYCCADYHCRDDCRVPGFNIRSVESCTAANKRWQRVQCADVVSIFALSNRVLLLSTAWPGSSPNSCFNIRSVESCTAAPGRKLPLGADVCFNIRSVESCTAASALPALRRCLRCFNIRSVESCTAALVRLAFTLVSPGFNIRSVESCTAAMSRGRRRTRGGFSFNIRSVESCTAASVQVSTRPVQKGVSIFALSNRVLLPALS